MNTRKYSNVLPDKTGLDVIWGVEAIAKVVKRSRRQTSHLLQTGQLAGKKKGKYWISTFSALRKDLSIEA